MTYRYNEDTLWVDMGRILVHNYPPRHNTVPYVTRLYMEKNKYPIPSKLIQGEPIYLYNLSPEAQAMVQILATANKSLADMLPRESFLKPVD